MAAAPGVTSASYPKYIQDAPIYLSNAAWGMWGIFRESTRWLREVSGLKNLVARPLDLIPQWAATGLFKVSPPVLRVCADMTRFKILISAVEVFTKVDTDLIAAPRNTREYIVIQKGERHVATTEYSIEELMVRKVGMIASWVFSLMDFMMYLRGSTLLSLGTKGLTRVSWVATAACTIAAVQGLAFEGRFLYRMAIAEKHTVRNLNLQNKVVEAEQDGKMAWDEIGSSMLKVALHVSCLALAICFAVPLLGYWFTYLQAAKLVALTSMVAFTLASHYWDRLVIGHRIPRAIQVAT